MKIIRNVGALVLAAALLPGCGSAPRAPAGVAVEEEAREFMAAYATDLREGNVESVAERYSRRGAYRLGHGQKDFKSYDSIAAQYQEGFVEPAEFEWDDLSYEVLSNDAVAVIGTFRWGSPDGDGVLASYTSLLVREDGDLRIRLEDESFDNLPPADCEPSGEGCELPLDSAEASWFAGEYQTEGEPGPGRVFEQDGSLMVESPGAPPMRLLYRGGNEFRIESNPEVRVLFLGEGERASSYILFTGLLLGSGRRVQ